MKKEEILFVRAMSVVAVLAVMTLILIFGLGNSLFIGIADDINSNTIDMTQAGSSIYNLYFYKGVNVLYVPLFSIALFASIIGAVGIMTKFRGSGVLAGAGATAMVCTGIYTVFTYIAEGSSTLHGFIAGFYLDDVSESIETARLMGIVPLIFAIILIVLGVMVLLLIKSSRINRMEAYAAKNNNRTYGILMLIAYGSVYMEWIRPVIINAACGRNEMVDLANTFVTDYFFDGKWFMNLSYAWFVIAAVVLVLLLRKQSREMGRRKLVYVSAGVPIVLIVIRSVIYNFNRPRLFGYLTVDDMVCDTVEAAIVPYMLMFLADVLFMVIMAEMLMLGACDTKKMSLSLVINLVVSVMVIVLAGLLTGAADGRYVLAAIYAGCAVAAVAGLAILSIKTGNGQRVSKKRQESE